MGLFNSIRLGSSAAGDYEIERSLRFNDNDTAYLSRNFGTGGNRKKWTFSAWIKRANLGGSAGEMRIFGGSTNASHIFFTTNDALTWDVAAPGSSASANLTTSQLFRDPSAWYHIVCALDTDESTADNRMRMYINGSEITSFGTRTNPSSGYAANAINADAFADGDRSLHTIGYRTSVQGSAGMEFDGYMAEINFIDGQQYDPSYFGATDVLTGQWNPKKYGGGYGTTGFYLSLIDNSGTTATTLGKDSSGNSNNFTPNNFSVAAGVGNDSLEDSPTNNFCTLSPLTGNGAQFSTSSNGNLDFSCASGTGQRTYGSMLIPETGKWYAEVVFSSGGQHSSYGVINPIDGSSLVNLEFSVSQEQIRADNSYLESSTESWGNGNVLGIKVDRDAGTIQFAVDGTNASTAINLSEMDNSSQLVFTASRTEGGGANVAGSFNFGQRPFSHLPTDYKSLCTANLPDPTIKKPNQHFETLLWTGNSTDNRAITGLNFQPDLTWIKRRSGGAQSHFWVDALRSNTDGSGGNGNVGPLATNDTYAETNTLTDGGFESFNSDGFTLGKGSSTANADAPYQRNNASSETYVAWNWNAGGSTVTNDDGSISAQVRANTSAGFSIITYSGNGSNSSSVGHGLGVTPDAVLIRKRNGSANWVFESPHTYNGRGMYLNFSDGSNGSGTDTTSRDSTKVTFNNSSDSNRRVNHSGDNYVMYCFSNVSQYSKIGKYTGNGSSDGTFVYTGFKVQFLLIKKTNTSESWILADTKRNSISGRESPADSYILADASNAESTGIIYDMLSNGFKFRSTSQNTNGHTYLYMAFAESPFKYARAR